MGKISDMPTKAIILVGSLALTSFIVPTRAQTNAPAAVPIPPTEVSSIPTNAVTPRPVIFHPPGGVSGGILPIRVGGGSRGGKADDLSVVALVPDQIGLTLQGQPSLYWYQSKAAQTRCEVAVTEPKNPKPLLVLKSSDPTSAGYHAIRLAKFKIELKPNVLYRWSVAIVIDPQSRSQDIIATGIIKRVEPSPSLAGKLAQASDSEKSALYAENGIWYDALQSVSDQIERSPQNASLRQERTSLLAQVGMDGAGMEAPLAKAR